MGNESDEIASLRSALIEALWDSGRHGCGLDECTDSVACPACQADLGADVDAILDALGLEQVGWFYRDSTEPYLLWSSNTVKAPDWGTVLGSTPAYRLRALSTEEVSDGR